MQKSLRALIGATLLAACAVAPSPPIVWHAFPEISARVGLEVTEIRDGVGVANRRVIVVERGGRSSRIGDEYEVSDHIERFSLYRMPDDKLALVMDITPFVLEGLMWRMATESDQIAAWVYLGAFDAAGEAPPRFYSPAEQSECVDPHDEPSGITVELTNRRENTCERR